MALTQKQKLEAVQSKIYPSEVFDRDGRDQLSIERNYLLELTDGQYHPDVAAGFNIRIGDDVLWFNYRYAVTTPNLDGKFHWYYACTDTEVPTWVDVWASEKR